MSRVTEEELLYIDPNEPKKFSRSKKIARARNLYMTQNTNFPTKLQLILQDN